MEDFSISSDPFPNCPGSLLALDLGLFPYSQALEFQRKLASERIRGSVPDLLLFLSHPPTITLGKNAKRTNLLVPERVLCERGIECYKVERGGDITYHGPGQVIGYPILHLKRFGLGVNRYVKAIETVLIRTLREFGISARTQPGLTGVWVGRGKIASIGVQIQKWVTWHGFALNVADETESFRLVIPCGLRGTEITCIENLCGIPMDRSSVTRTLLRAFVDVFEIDALHMAPLIGHGSQPL
jgi:lipoate-protein ligase B